MTAVEEPDRPGLSYDDLDLVRRAVDIAATVAPASQGEPELIDRIAHLESLQHRLAALQADAIHAFARQHAATWTAEGSVRPEQLERSIATQIGHACRTSAMEGRRRLHTARDLHDGLDHVRALFAAGRLSAYAVSVIANATAHLDRAARAQVDQWLAEHPLPRLGVGRIGNLTRKLAAQADPEAFRARTTAARAARRVTLRPAQDGMTDLIAHLPVELGVACFAALRKAVVAASVSREPMTRGAGQIMADTLVERLTGRAAPEQTDLHVQIVVPLEALVDPDSPLPAEIPGHGPVPADLLTTATGRTTWRRLVTREGIVIGGGSAQRAFTGMLATLVRARDGHRCREPFCDAPGRETDHIRGHADGGPTTFANGRTVCRFHNQLRETPGWRVTRAPGGIRTTTPTGHSYLSPPNRGSPGPPATRSGSSTRSGVRPGPGSRPR